MINRVLYPQLVDAVAHSPAVALRGPRQVGKTTLALEIGQRHNALYLDLESERDRSKLAQAELYLADHQDKRRAALAPSLDVVFMLPAQT